MMEKVIFWVCLAAVGYCYVGYPLMLWFRQAMRRPRAVPDRNRIFPGTVSIVIAARNERERIGGRVREFCHSLTRCGLDGEIIVVSDGSSDGTGAAVGAINDARVHLIDLPQHVGKAAAITLGSSAARGCVLVFADCRQAWELHALQYLVATLAGDSSIGAVSGELVLKDEPGLVSAGVGLYWRFEKWLRQMESDLGGMSCVSGSICAVRRELFEPIPQGTILDDVYWPLRVCMGGHRIVHEPRAIAYDRLPDRASDEFRRKVRTLAGNFQLLSRLPSAILPWRNPAWLQFLSHKLLRLVVPWALIAMLACSFQAQGDGALYAAALWGQLAMYAIALAGVSRSLSRRFRLAAAASSFVLLNAAAWFAFWVWISGRSARFWSKVAYSPRGGAAQ